MITITSSLMCPRLPFLRRSGAPSGGWRSSTTDKNKDPWAETIFKQIIEAYQVLGNPKKRAAYDAERRAEAQRAEERQRGQQGPRYTLARCANQGLRPRLMDLIWRKSDALPYLWC